MELINDLFIIKCVELFGNEIIYSMYVLIKRLGHVNCIAHDNRPQYGSCHTSNVTLFRLNCPAVAGLSRHISIGILGCL